MWGCAPAPRASRAPPSADRSVCSKLGSSQVCPGFSFLLGPHGSPWCVCGASHTAGSLIWVFYRALLSRISPLQVWLVCQSAIHPNYDCIPIYFLPDLLLLLTVQLGTSKPLQQGSCWFLWQALPCLSWRDGESSPRQECHRMPLFLPKVCQCFISKCFSQVVICLCLVSRALKWLFLTILPNFIVVFGGRGFAKLSILS